jgi:AraC-like DNA-binding protein
MSNLEAAARGGAFTLFVMLALLLFRDGREAQSARVGGLLSLGVAAYVIDSTPGLIALSPTDAPWIVPVRLASIGVPALFWLFSTASFDDEFRPSWRHGVPWLASVGLGAVCTLGPWRWLWLASAALSLGFVVLACWQAVVGRNADLIESRRRFRLFLIGLIAAYTAVVIIASLRAGGQQPEASGLANAVALLAMAALVSGTRLTLRNVAQPMPTTSLPGGLPPPLPAGSAPEVSEHPSGPQPDPTDEADSAALLDRLRDLMEARKVFREEGLSISGLAERMAIPEYRLRRLINQRLGHRNFSAFVNSYRLAEAKAALADPGQAEVPVLTIALDAGFQSIGPFNRAFKAHTGLTPTEFRRTKLLPPTAKPAD